METDDAAKFPGTNFRRAFIPSVSASTCKNSYFLCKSWTVIDGVRFLFSQCHFLWQLFKNVSLLLELVTMPLSVDIPFNYFNVVCNFWTTRGRTFILVSIETFFVAINIVATGGFCCLSEKSLLKPSISLLWVVCVLSFVFCFNCTDMQRGRRLGPGALGWSHLLDHCRRSNWPSYLNVVASLGYFDCALSI